MRPDIASDIDLSEPPAELWQAFATAAAAYDRLEAAGTRLHFATSPHGGVRVEVHDSEGNLRSAISGAVALRIAGGWSSPDVDARWPAPATTASSSSPG